MTDVEAARHNLDVTLDLFRLQLDAEDREDEFNAALDAYAEAIRADERERATKREAEVAALVEAARAVMGTNSKRIFPHPAEWALEDLRHALAPFLTEEAQ